MDHKSPSKNLFVCVSNLNSHAVVLQKSNSLCLLKGPDFEEKMYYKMEHTLFLQYVSSCEHSNESLCSIKR
jgi:hypothetical protein